MKTAKRIFSTGLAALVSLLMIDGTLLTARAANKFDLTVAGDPACYTQDSATGDITITGISSFTITGSGQPTSETITVKGCNPIVTLDNVNIKANSGKCAFMLSNSSSVSLVLEGTNKLVSDGNHAGLSVSSGNEVDISSPANSGSLTVRGAPGGAGIGGDLDESCGTVRIDDVTVNAYGGGSGAGIGGGGSANGSGSGGSVYISGGAEVRAESDESQGFAYGAGIGGGILSPGGLVSITGSGTSVTASGNGEGNDIGSGGGNSGYSKLTVGDINTKTFLPELILEHGTINSVKAMTNCKIRLVNVSEIDTYHSIEYENLDASTTNINPSSYQEDEKTSLSDPIRPGYTFKGWYTDSGFTQKITGIDTSATSAVTVYAEWISQDTTMKNIALSSGTLSHQAATHDYTATVDNSVSDITVSATPNNPNETIRFISNGTEYTQSGNLNSKPIPLAAGAVTRIDILINAEDSHYTDYLYIYVTRSSAPANTGGQSGPVSTGGHSSSPSPVTVSGTQSGGGCTASIPSYDIDPYSVSAVTVNLDGNSVIFPAAVLSAARGASGGSLTITQSAPDAQEQALINQEAAKTGVNPVYTIDLPLCAVGSDGSSTPVAALSDSVPVTLHLTDAQAAAIDSSKAKVCFYDSSTGALSDMNAVFDLTAKTAVFKAARLGTFVIVMPVPKPSNVGVGYTSHVQGCGWQTAAADGALSGTTGKALRLEALRINLTGDNLTSGASITYQAHVQNLGWQNPVSNGDVAGTSGASLRLEALRITLSGLDGYEVQYRAYVQNKGWLDWVTTANGTDIKSAGIAGTTGRGLRVEAVEIAVKKIS